ncbi:UDP-3-O-(3-hydroxymyristoyl)glucosamine N-acyltransferase [Zavarzinia sp.]|uniref:UDP-3-O-(3-hydroxymyristoyl)glucosamine N-acyltransferase n=1 Tax=Zavarzinia sp. TaxID=2027920 RepID=UPI003567074E
MPGPRFFVARGPFSLRALAGIAGADLADGADPDLSITGAAPLEFAEVGHVTFVGTVKYLPKLAETRAGACILRPEQASRAPRGLALLLSKQPAIAYARVAQAFHPRRRATPGIAAGAVVAPDAVLGEDCEIGPFAVVGAGARLGRGVILEAHAVVGPEVELGDEVHVGAHASVACTVAGPRCTFAAGARIGEAGFGFVPNPPAGHLRIPQIGRVVLGADVEVGANSCIDRGVYGDTVIGDGTIIDNLVQIGHNVRLGRGCVLAAKVGLSGSCTVGDFVAFGGNAGVADHVIVGSGAQIAAHSGVMRDVPPGGAYGGTPAVPVKQWFREVATLSRLAQHKGNNNG